MKNITRHLLTTVVAGCSWLALSTVSVSAAGTDTWVGNTDANWNTAGNWTTAGGSTPPAAGDSLLFGSAGTSGSTLTNNISNLSLNGITLNGPGAFTVSGNALTLTGGLTNASTATEVISVLLSGTGGVVNPAGTVTLGGANTYTGNTVLGDGTDAAVLNQPAPTVGATNVATPVLYLSFDKVAGKTVLNEGSGGAVMNGAIMGTASIVSGGRLGGNCLSVPALLNSGYVKINNPVVAMTGAGSWTIGMWIKTSTAGAVYAYQGDGGWTSGNMSFYLNAGNTTSGTHAGGVSYAQGWQTGTAVCNDGNWHYVVMTRNGSATVLYVDGSVDASTSSWGAGTGVGKQLWIGASGDSADGAAGLNGLIDEVSVYNTALTLTQVQSLYAAGTLEAGTISPASSVSVAAAATLDLYGRAQTVAGLSGSGTVDSTLASGKPALIVNNSTTNASVFSGAITNSGATSALSLIQAGTNSLTLNGTAANGYTGSTMVNGGTLIEDFANATSAANLISSSSPLVLGGGTLQVKQQSAITTSQTFAGTTVSPGASVVNGTQVGSGAVNIALGAITQVPGGTVDFTNNSTGATTTTTSPIVNGILGGWATVGNNIPSTTSGGWATTNGSGQIVPYAGYTTVSGTTISAASASTQNWITDGGTLTTGGTVNSLIERGGTGDFIVNNSITLTIASGGIFIEGVNQRWLVAGGSASTLKSGLTTGEMYIHSANNAYNDYEIRPVIADGSVATTVYKDGPGNITLGGYAKTYSGGTVVNGGTLQLALGGATGVIRGTLTINPGATATATVLDAIGYTTGVTAININGGTFNIGVNANNGLLATVNLTGGTFSSTGGGAFNSAALGVNSLPSPITSVFSAPFAMRGAGLPISVAQGTTASGIDLNISGAIGYGSGGSGGITKTGAGTLELSGANTFTGSTTINAGTLFIGGGGKLGGGTYSGAIVNNGILNYGSTAAQTLSGVISGTGPLIVSGTGIPVVTASNTYTGGTVITNGTEWITSDAALGAVPGSPVVNLTLNGGTLHNNVLSVNLATNRTILLGPTGGYLDCGWGAINNNPNTNLTVNGLITGTGGLGINWDNGSVVLNATNNYQGLTTIGAAGPGYYAAAAANPTLALGIDNALPYGPNASNVVFGTSANANSVLLNLNGHNLQINGLSGSANAIISNSVAGSYTLTFGNNNAGGNYAGVIANTNSTLALTKIGSGLQTLSGTNTYNGNTTISGGTLALGATSSISNSANIWVASGAIFDVSTVSGGFTLATGQNLYGGGTNNGPITTSAAANIYADVGAGFATNTFNNNLTIAVGSTTYFNLGTNYNGANDFISISGSLVDNGSVSISAPSTSAKLATNSDYVLMTAAGGFSGSVSPTPLWGVKPLNWANFTVITNANGVLLHYTASTPPIIVAATASPTPVTRNQHTLITATVVQGTSSITNATLDASVFGLSASIPLVFDSALTIGLTNVYTNSISIPANTAIGGPYVMPVTVVDSAPLTASVNISLNVVATNQVWNGAGPDANTDDNTNWVSGAAPGYFGDSMAFAGSVNTNPNMDQNYTVTGLAFSNNAASFTIGGGNTLTLSGSGPIANYSTNTQNLNMTLADSGGGLTASGVGPIVLGTTESYTGPTTVSSGTLNVSSSASVTSTGVTTVGNTATNAVLINNGGMSQLKINVGTVSNAVGAIYQNSSYFSESQAGGATDFQIGNAAGAYGYLNVSGGTVGTYELGIAGESGAGNGLVDLYGGTISDGGWLVISRVTGASPQTGVLNIFGGTLYYGNTGGGTFATCWGSGQTAVINILGGSIQNNSLTTSGFNLNQSGNASNTGILNLNGGTAQAYNVFGSYAQLNFNGGTLQPSAANASFVTGLGSARIYSGGATINDNGNAITINQALLAPTGNGVTTPTITSGGAGYVAPPIVTITNGVGDTTGSGATAFAQIDNSTGNITSGQVTNIIITCPGVNYSVTPTFVLSGGGASTPAVITGNANAANISGGLTKTGSTTLTLGGSSTYTGNTVINGGSLQLSAPVLHLSFDNVSGGTVINQGSGGTNMNGTLTGTASIVSGGRFGNALSIPSGLATNAFVLITNSVNPLNITSPNNNWTLGMWLKTSTAGGVYAYQGSGGWSSGNTEFYLENGTAGDGAGTHAGGVRYAQGWQSGTNVINDGNWHFVVMTCNNGTKAQYVDGTLDSLAINQWNGAGNGSEVCIGGTPSGTADSQIGLNGLIDEVYIYNRALGQSEIQQIYNNNSPQVLPTNTLVNVTSGTLDAGGLSQQVGMLTGSGNVLLDDNTGALGALVVGNGSTNTFSGAISDTSGAGSLIKVGTGKLTLSGANTYGGSTVISNGTLVVSGSVGAGPVIVASAGTLGGSGTVNGSVTVSGNVSPSGEGTFSSPGTTLTTSSNLTLAAGGICSLALSSSYNGANDQIIVTGVLTNNNPTYISAIHISGPSTLDQSADYVLIQTSGGVAGTYSSTVVWDGTPPSNAANFTITTNSSQVLLHYTATTPPTASISAAPATASRNQSVLVTLNETNGSSGYSNVVLNASSIGAGYVTLNLSTGSGGINVFTNTIAASASTLATTYTLGAIVTDSNGLTVGVSFSLNVVTTNDVWNGLGAGNNIAVNLNWTNGAAPGYVGDSLEFAGSTRTSPNLETNYTVTGVTFDNTASNFNIGTLNSSTLAITANGVANNSAYAQTLNVPVTLSAAQTLNAASGPLALGSSLTNGGYLVTVAGVSNSTVNSISGAGGLTKNGAGILTLSGASTYTGNTTIGAGTLNLSGSQTGAGGQMFVGSTAANSVLQISGSLTMSNLMVGNASGAVGAVYQTGGSVSDAVATAYDNSCIGNILGAFGYYYAGGGTFASAGIAVGGEQNTANIIVPTGVTGGNGILDINGSTVNDSGYLVMSRGATNETGILNVFNGTLTYAGGGIVANWGSGNQVSIINILGGVVSNTAAVGFNLNQSGNVTNTGILNLNGGVARGNVVAGAHGQVNFNGGTLKASAANGTFMTGLGGALIYSNGATIDNNGVGITIGQSLQAPAGYGVNSITVASGGSGYIAPPIVSISGGAGTGATAIAQINQATGVVTNILVTSAGNNYLSSDTLTVTFAGGGGSGAAANAPVLAANVGGGLTVNGTGLLTLTSTNTFTGPTVINGGTIQLYNEAELGIVPGSPAINITLNGGGLYNNNSSPVFSANRTIYLGTNGGYLQAGWQPQGRTFIINGLITGPGSLNINWDASPIYLNATNTYQGDTTIGTAYGTYYNNVAANPVLALGIDNALPYGTSAGNVAFGTTTNNNTATLNLNGHNAQINGLNSTGTNAIVDNTVAGTTNVLTIGNNNQGGFFAGVIQNTGGVISLIKTGSGLQQLTGTDSYTGNTTVNGGILAITQATLATNSTVTVVSGANFSLGFSTTNQVAYLVLGGVSQAAGVYNNGNSSLISGSGSLQVLVGSSGLSTNADLTSLVFSPSFGFAPAFSSNVLTGYAETNAYLSTPTVTVTNADPTATNTLIVNGVNLGQLTNSIASLPLTLGVGSTNVVQVQVVSQSGSVTNLYVVNVTEQGPPLSTNAYLTSLVFSPSLGFAPAFTSNIMTGYNETNAYLSTPTVTVTNADATATNTLIVNGINLGQLTNSIASVPLTLGVGSTNVVQVQVVSQSGSVTNLYVVNVTEQGPPLSTNALLLSLAITPAGTLNPTFASGTWVYNATNAYTNNPVTVTATSSNAFATLQFSFNGGAYGAVVTNNLTSGSTSLLLNPPTNTVAVRVVSQDLSQTNVYTVNVLLQPSQTVPKLTNNVSAGNLNLSWPADHLGYRLLVQTKNLNKGVSSNTNDWGTVVGSTLTTTTNLPIIKVGVTNEYYRLVYP